MMELDFPTRALWFLRLGCVRLDDKRDQAALRAGRL